MEVREQTEIEKIVKSFRSKKQFWTLTEVAAFLSISQRKAWDMVNRGELKAVKVSGEWRVNVEWLIEYLQENSNFTCRL